MKERVDPGAGKVRSQYVDRLQIEKGKREYRNAQREKTPILHDELSGVDETQYRLEVDHIQAAAAASYNERYLRQDKISELKEFYNSADNFQMLEKRLMHLKVTFVFILMAKKFYQKMR